MVEQRASTSGQIEERSRCRRSYLYWTSTFDRSTPSELGTTINRASLDGTGVETGFITGARAPAGVAVAYLGVVGGIVALRDGG
jgi:hypothetical protein